MRLFSRPWVAGMPEMQSNFRRTTDGTPLMQEHFPALQQAPVRVAP